jgi:hypothetical protein
MDAMVISPSGGFAAFFEINFRACLKLQYVSGYFGLISIIFMIEKVYPKLLRQKISEKQKG